MHQPMEELMPSHQTRQINQQKRALLKTISNYYKEAATNIPVQDLHKQDIAVLRKMVVVIDKTRRRPS